MKSEMSKQLTISDKIVINKILFIRGEKVMLDRDLAEMYGVKSIRLREQVKRNLERFPKNFMFQLSESEVEILLSQNAIPSKKSLGGSMPYAFTEHGVLMLSNVIKNKTAIKVSIRIIEVFVKMRELLSTHKDILLKLEQIEKQSSQHNKEIQYIFDVLKQLISEPNPPRKKVGYKHYDEK